MPSRLFLVLFILILLRPAVPAAAAPLRVASLHTVLTEIATTLGADAVTVIPVIPAGADPHTYDPTPADLRRLIEADLVLLAGLGLEPYLDRLAANVASPDRLLSVGDRLPPALLLATGEADHDHHGHDHHHHGEYDPHWWQSPTLTRAAIHIVARELAARLPAAAPAIYARADTWSRDITAAQNTARTAAAAIPAERRQLVTAHDAFGYLARELGLTVVPLAGLSTAQEPDARRFAALIDQIRRDRIPALFLDANYPPTLIEALQRETSTRLGGTLYPDGLGPADSPAATWSAMFNHNVTTVLTALSATP
jgi:zinc/manganese transport system substrate-binding protein